MGTRRQVQFVFLRKAINNYAATVLGYGACCEIKLLFNYILPVILASLSPSVLFCTVQPAIPDT